jgi:hypothetical protein
MLEKKEKQRRGNKRGKEMRRKGRSKKARWKGGIREEAKGKTRRKEIRE